MYSKNGENLIIGTNSGEISDGTETINRNAFFGRGVTGIIDIPDSVNTIESEAFAYNKIEKLNLSNSVTDLGSRAFADNNIKTLIISKNLTELIDESFRRNNLETVYLYNKDVMIDDNVFIGNPNDFVIRGYEGSTAKSYADDNNYPFEPFYIPDDNLRIAINDQLGENESYEPTKSDLKSLTELVASSSGIEELTGLEHATNLEFLSLEFNNINDISALGSLTELIELYLTDNLISDISTLENLDNLEKLYLDFNNINDISALGNLTNLVELALYNNNISDITTLGSLTELEVLVLGVNQISDISALGSLIELEFLALEDNNINDISALGSLIELEFLALEDNNINDISAVGSLTKLKELYLNDNHILDLSPLKDFFGNLVNGNLSNQIIELPEMSLLDTDTELETPNPVRDYFGDVLHFINPDNGHYDEDSEMIKWTGLTGSSGDTTYLTFTFDDHKVYGFTGTVT